MKQRRPSAKSPKKRGPGRPSAAAGAVDQRERMLDAALAMFSERGIAATSLRAIATAAHVTPALLHYYFNSKESLVETLLAERIAPFVAVSVAPLLAPLPSPRATLRRFLETHMRNIAANPWMPRLMVREVLSEGGALRERMQAQFAAIVSPKTLFLIISAQRRGEIRPDLNPVLVGVSLISLAVFPFAAAPMWRAAAQAGARTLLDGLDAEKRAALKLTAKAIAGRKGFDQPDTEALIAHTLTVFDSMLEVPSAKTRR